MAFDAGLGEGDLNTEGTEEEQREHREEGEFTTEVAEENGGSGELGGGAPLAKKRRGSEAELRRERIDPAKHLGKASGLKA